MLSRTPVPHLPWTSRGAHASTRANAHARARIEDAILTRAAEARPCYNCARLPEPSTPQAVLWCTAVPKDPSQAC
ncbi:hypothetical protein JCGZ_06594 [Jatropha curcas]|uniref:Uncharacterized protein n=1 Tax=Jatropha curcas TaxID=180498 RepID=A0A067LFP2_JATCU|nr:hypothetical protein JCGZ_06594 [Jatropha curcas]